MYMENVINHWDQMGVLQKCMEHKLVYLETKDVVETTLALDNYKKACDSGRGAVFLSIARGKVAEGIDFDNHYGRCVVLFGIPYQYTKSHVLRARLDFMREKYQVIHHHSHSHTSYDLLIPVLSMTTPSYSL
jgi:DNA excision repair protein ERCC-2